MLVKSLLEKKIRKSFKKKVPVHHQRNYTTVTGHVYNIDLSYTFSIGHAEHFVIIECKNWQKRVERDIVLSLEAKRRELSAHKAIIVSSAGFQKGAIELALNLRIGMFQLTSLKSLNILSHFRGNFNPYRERLETAVEFENSQFDQLYGITTHSQSISDYLRLRFCLRLDNIFSESVQELQPQVLAQLSRLPANWYKEYQLLETCGIPLILDNANDIRVINLLKLTSTIK
ncbi:restriction endonuclease [Chryseotalea sanaruensis]|uniref:restriction endonuclease n=1 Tax=Chryseotalea sanaruensis TaxID=2482724 RepID=UPI00351F1618